MYLELWIHLLIVLWYMSYSGEYIRDVDKVYKWQRANFLASLFLTTFTLTTEDEEFKPIKCPVMESCPRPSPYTNMIINLTCMPRLIVELCSSDNILSLKCSTAPKNNFTETDLLTCWMLETHGGLILFYLFSNHLSVSLKWLCVVVTTIWPSFKTLVCFKPWAEGPSPLVSFR